MDATVIRCLTKITTRRTLLQGCLRAVPAVNLQSMAKHSSKLMSFQLLGPQSDNNGPRIGSLDFQGRNPIVTPHYVAVTSRGAVPHLSQDMTRDNTSIRALYTAVEDCE